MRKFIIDTNILLLYIRSDWRWNVICERFGLKNQEVRNFIAAVNLGELYSLALQNNWGQTRFDALSNFRTEFIVIDINIDSIIKRYAEIDAFSQGKLKKLPSNLSARNMGKNDLWIAATASLYNLTLLTADSDFTHLETLFLDLRHIDIRTL